MIVNIPLATGNKLNCFISAREMFSFILPCALVLFFVLFFIDLYMLINHFLEKQKSKVVYIFHVYIYLLTID